jgi:hypothetical protein
MGVYVYSVRTRSIETDIGTAFALGYLFKDHFDRSPICEAMVSRAEAVWEGREKPTLVFHAEEGNKPYVGSPVYRWNGVATCYDTPGYGGSEGVVGYLSSHKVGRKTCWKVEPVCYEVVLLTGRLVQDSRIFFNPEEVTNYIQSNLKPGDQAEVQKLVPTNYSESALERLGRASDEAKTKMAHRLTTGPWPFHMVTPDEAQAAFEMMTNGKVVLYAEKNGNLNFKATFRLFDLRSDNYNLTFSLDETRIVFKGGKHGEHSLDRLGSTPERIKAHWQGYCENNGAQAL